MLTMSEGKRKSILVAPLNWGLGHATRCIPIIQQLIKRKFKVIIASDGQALKLLKQEFPMLKTLELPGYNISYAKNKNLIKLKLLANAPRILNSIKAEREIIRSLVDDEKITGIISDNRFGVYDNRIPSVFISHQLNVLSGNTSWLSTKLNERFINRFTECWIPDYTGANNLSGRLSHNTNITSRQKFIGVISRFKYEKIKMSIEILIILSGPEPYRELLELQLIELYKCTEKRVELIRGVVEKQSISASAGNITVYNYLTSEALQNKINEAELIICRSGYSSILDLAKLRKKAFFIPTPGQYEQQYLARRMQDLKIAPYCQQNHLTLENLKHHTDFNGFELELKEPNFEDLFLLF